MFRFVPVASCAVTGRHVFIVLCNFPYIYCHVVRFYFPHLIFKKKKTRKLYYELYNYLQNSWAEGWMRLQNSFLYFLKSRFLCGCHFDYNHWILRLTVTDFFSGHMLSKFLFQFFKKANFMLLKICIFLCHPHSCRSWSENQGEAWSCQKED